MLLVFGVAESFTGMQVLRRKGGIFFYNRVTYVFFFLLLFFFRREESDVRNALNYNQKQLKELKDSKTDRLKRFGPYVPALLEAIDDAYRRGQFTYKPVGPLGICHRFVRI